MRRLILVANWKMNGSKSQIKNLLQDLLPKLIDIRMDIDLVVCPPVLYLDQVSQVIQSSNLLLGAQNLCQSSISAFTGEISAEMLCDFNCKYVIIGHSERRQLLGETDGVIAAKVEQGLNVGLRPILCVGETREEMEAGRGFDVISTQLDAVLERIGIEGFRRAVIAYEPIWAIGTGLTASPELAQSVHAKIRARLATLDTNVAALTRIVYGGSLNAANAGSLLKEKDIDGGLIGGASLKAQDFSDICHTAMSVVK